MVTEACARWRRDPAKKRPVPGEFLYVCREIVAEQRAANQLAIAKPKPEIPPEPFPSLAHYRWVRIRADEAAKLFIDCKRPNLEAYREAFPIEDERCFLAYKAAWLKLEWGPDWWRKFGGFTPPPLDMIERAEEFFCTHSHAFTLPERKEWPRYEPRAGGRPFDAVPRYVAPSTPERAQELLDRLRRDQTGGMTPPERQPPPRAEEELDDEIPF